MSVLPKTKLSLMIVLLTLEVIAMPEPVTLMRVLLETMFPVDSRYESPLI